MFIALFMTLSLLLLSQEHQDILVILVYHDQVCLAVTVKIADRHIFGAMAHTNWRVTCLADSISPAQVNCDLVFLVIRQSHIKDSVAIQIAGCNRRRIMPNWKW